MKKLVAETFINWLPSGVAVFSIYCTMFIALQQYVRRTADDIPVQLAEDTREKILKGVPYPDAIKGIAYTDMQKSLAPFVIICDKEGVELASSARLGTSVPAIPPGVLQYARQNGENRRTWQPAPGVRCAIDVLYFNFNGGAGYVTAGHSLRETEIKEQFLRTLTTTGTLLTLCATYITQLVALWSRKKKT